MQPWMDTLLQTNEEEEEEEEEEINNNIICGYQASFNFILFFSFSFLCFQFHFNTITGIDRFTPLIL